MNELVYDNDELTMFFNNVLPELAINEGYFICLNARKKYLTEEEYSLLQINKSNELRMLDRKVIRDRDLDYFLKKINQYEIKHKIYKSKSDKSIPVKCMVLYINVNPVDFLKAYKTFSSDMNEIITASVKCGVDGNKIGAGHLMGKVKRSNELLMSAFQKSKGKKHYIDIDFDIPANLTRDILYPFLRELKSRDISYFVISTKNGYHVLIKTSTLNFNYNELVKYYNDILIGVNVKGEVLVNKNQMIPLPGTVQGGYKVKVLYDL
jgi:hypothetical protein